MASPLVGKRIVVTRRPEQAAGLIKRLRELGAEPIAFPTIVVVSLPALDLDAALEEIGTFDWLIFTSTNAVQFFFERIADLGVSTELPPMAVIGSATEAALRRLGHVASAMPDEFTGQALARTLGNLTGQHVLLPRAKQGRVEIVTALTEAGAAVADIALYATMMPEPLPQLVAEVQRSVDVLTFTSPSTARNFFRMVDARIDPNVVICCIGPTTADAVRLLGHSVQVMPDEYTMDAMVDALVEYYQSAQSSFLRSASQRGLHVDEDGAQSAQ